MTLNCSECSKPRDLYTAHKLRLLNQQSLEKTLDNIIYTCGMDIQECIPVELADEAKQNHVLSNVFVRQNLSCSSRIEILSRMFLACVHILRSQ